MSDVCSLDPIAAAARLAGRPGRVVLLSARAASGSGRYSIVASDPSAVINSAGGDPFAALDALPRDASSLVPVAIGYLGYDVGAEAAGVERWTDPVVEPEMWFGIYPAIYRYDHQLRRGEILASNERDAAALAGRLARDVPSAGGSPVLGPLLPSPGADDAYRAGFARVSEYLQAGDCYQVNLARRLVAAIEEPGDPLELFATLCAIKPEPFAAMIETGAATILSGSPERFLHRRASGARLETRPIKGTRPRLGDELRDRAAQEELINSEKERAEHLMIVDLERNDLGHVAVTGSVEVDAFAEILTLPTLFHMASTVSCQPLPGVVLADILRATFPGGSITGAPKRRAMEIIRELEPAPRGVYTGALGMLGANGAVDLAIAIRTAVLCDASLSLHVGGGIVADSSLAREMAETDEKAAGWRRVVDAMRVGNRGTHARVEPG